LFFVGLPLISSLDTSSVDVHGSLQSHTIVSESSPFCDNSSVPFFFLFREYILRVLGGLPPLTPNEFTSFSYIRPPDSCEAAGLIRVTAFFCFGGFFPRRLFFFFSRCITENAFAAAFFVAQAAASSQSHNDSVSVALSAVYFPNVPFRPFVPVAIPFLWPVPFPLHGKRLARLQFFVGAMLGSFSLCWYPSSFFGVRLLKPTGAGPFDGKQLAHAFPTLRSLPLVLPRVPRRKAIRATICVVLRYFPPFWEESLLLPFVSFAGT